MKVDLGDVAESSGLGRGQAGLEPAEVWQVEAVFRPFVRTGSQPFRRVPMLAGHVAIREEEVRAKAVPIRGPAEPMAAILAAYIG